MPADSSVLFPQAPKTLVESAYRQLRRDIIEGRLRPDEKLRVEHLKNDYQVGAGTLREALAHLVADALVVVQGQRGFRVAPISLDDLADITRTRALLETEALRQSIALGDDVWESEVLAAFHRLSRTEERLQHQHDHATVAEWELRNQAFHEALIAACPSHWIRHFLAVLYHQSERYRRISMFNASVPPTTLHAQHAAIAHAATARDSQQACALLATHIQLTLEVIQALPPETLS